MKTEHVGVLMHAYLDDELDAARSLDVSMHLEACTECRAEYERQLAMQQTIRNPFFRYRAPPHVEHRVITSLPGMDVRRAPRWNWLTGSMAAGLMGLVLMTGVQTYRLRDRTENQLADAALAGHLRSLLADHLTDIQISDRHQVKPWMDRRLDYAPQVWDLTGAGFELVGGRLDILDEQRIAALIYRRRLHVINLYQWPAPASSSFERTRNGYTVRSWSNGDMRYVAVSDISAGDFDAFEAALRKAPDLKKHEKP